jgi:hypothetical protein
MKRIEYQQLRRPYAFSSPFGRDSFAICLYVADPSVTPDEQATLSREIVRQGCRYAVCAGERCSSWDDSIDMADLERNNWEVKDATFVMTTWHEDESVEDIVLFFLNNMRFDDWTAVNFLVAVIGGNAQMLADFQREIERQEESNRASEVRLKRWK